MRAFFAVTALLAIFSFSALKAQQNPPKVGMTDIQIQAKSVGHAQPVPGTGTVNVKLTVQFNAVHHSHQCVVDASVDVPPNTMTRSQIAAQLAAAITAQIKTCLLAKNIPNAAAVAGSFVRLHDETILVRGTIPGQGHNVGTLKKPVLSTPGKVTKNPRARYFTRS